MPVGRDDPAGIASFARDCNFIGLAAFCRDMPTATWNNKVIAESDHTEQVEGNHYFPPQSIDRAYFEPSSHTTVCPWKGTAHYYHVTVDDQRNENAAWFYPDPKSAAANIKDHVAFWKGIKVG